MRRILPYTLAPLLFVAALPARAQLSDEAQISLITILPGDAIYSLWGHSAVRVHDPVQGIDLAYNYGTFDFGDPISFVVTFAYGKLDYHLSVHSYPAAAHVAGPQEGRTVIEQALLLSASQRNRLYQYLRTNALPQNRTYRYNFLFDNCSTRVRDVFETVLGDSIRFAADQEHVQTFRQLIGPYAAGLPLLRFMMNLGMGLPADHTVTSRELMFLPTELSTAFDEASLALGETKHPLVARTDTVYAASGRPVAWPWAMILGWLLLAAGVFVTASRQVLPGRIFDGILFGVTGVAGLLIVFLWFFSLHDITQGNLNILWAWPTHLAVTWHVARGRTKKWLRMYMSATAVVTLGFVLVMAFLPQVIPGALLPILLLLVLRSAGPIQKLAVARLPKTTLAS